MKTEKYIKKYIHDLFGADIKVSFKRHLYNKCVGYATPLTNSICLVYRVRKYFDTYKGVIWHEVGHLKTIDGNENMSIKGEMKAQQWAMKEAKKQGKNQVYEQLLTMVYNWTQLTKGDGYRWLTYRIAGQRILKQLGI